MLETGRKCLREGLYSGCKILCLSAIYNRAEDLTSKIFDKDQMESMARDLLDSTIETYNHEIGIVDIFDL